MKRHRLHRIRRARGFTLIELMVALIAGLFVALAVVGLSAQATNTFHEEARTASSEMTLRTAVERLRADLQRAGYMSTGNIQTDTYIAHAPGSPNMATAGPFTALYRLAGIRLYSSGSSANAPLSVTAGFTPDAIELSGNYTSTDDYVVRYADSAASSCGGTRLWLAADSPAMWRILSQSNPDASLEAAFQPVQGYQFIARIADDTGHFQYLPTCTGKAAGVSGGAGIAATPYIDLDPTMTLLTASATKTNGGASGLGVGRLRVNPVQTVRWEIRPINTTQAGDAPFAQLVTPATSDGGTSDKYELFRTYLDVTGALTPAPEIVAEYAVDLKFAFSADTGLISATPRTLTVYGFTDANNAVIANDVTVNITATPQRIRSVHFRLSTRSAVADRAETYVAPQANLQQLAYPTRYCVLAACVSGQTGWARIRSITSETSTPNLAKLFY
jgi:prepilin-type N-terminal cleavage/methylation domain-containing protein